VLDRFRATGGVLASLLQTAKGALTPAGKLWLFERYESFYRLLVRATNPRPAQRFSSADEMATQCKGVLREILAELTGVPRPGTSVLFSMPRSAFGAELALHRTDVFVDGRRHDVRLSARSVARVLPTPAPTEDPETDWRMDWDDAITALESGVLRTALGCFERVVGALPGEAAPKLASAATAELMLDTEDAPDAERLRQSAERHYRTLWRTDHSIVSAAFGLVRRLAARDDRAGDRCARPGSVDLAPLRPCSADVVDAASTGASTSRSRGRPARCGAARRPVVRMSRAPCRCVRCTRHRHRRLGARRLPPST
jgi:hypothetical protein